MMMYQSLTTVSSNSVTVYKWEKKKIQSIALYILTYFTVILRQSITQGRPAQDTKVSIQPANPETECRPSSLQLLQTKGVRSTEPEAWLNLYFLKDSETDLTLSTRDL